MYISDSFFAFGKNISAMKFGTFLLKENSYAIALFGERFLVAE